MGVCRRSARTRWLPFPSDEVATWPDSERLLPHALAVAEHRGSTGSHNGQERLPVNRLCSCEVIGGAGMADLGVARAEPVLPGPARPAHGQHDVGRAAQVEQDAGGWLGIAPLVVARSGTDQPTAGSGSIRQRRCPGLGDAMAADPGLRVADQGPGPHWDGSTGQRRLVNLREHTSVPAGSAPAGTAGSSHSRRTAAPDVTVSRNARRVRRKVRHRSPDGPARSFRAGPGPSRARPCSGSARGSRHRRARRA